MAFGFESGITSFFERRGDVFNENDIKGSFQERINDLKIKMQYKSNSKPTIVILGAGPAGLMRAIQSISNGNPTKVIERRLEDTPGRTNTVALTTTTIMMLQYCGIYQYLREKGLIYPINGGNYISVRLVDLENAMKEVLKKLSPDSIVQYDSQVTHIDSQSPKLKLVVKSAKGDQNTFSDIDILINAEGSRSSTNSLLGIQRTEVLPPIPVIAAIYKDNRPKIRNVTSFVTYTGKSVGYLAITIYYHTQFLFKFFLLKTFRRQITGSLILKTPKQNYLGCGFSDEINERLLSLKKVVDEKKRNLRNAQTEQEKKRWNSELKIAQKNYFSFTKYWINVSICHANLIALLLRFFRGPHFQMGLHLSLHNFEVIKIGADYANQSYKKINQSVVLLTGDACATVDPTTGLGCNTAIQSSVDFLDYIWDHDTKVPQDRLLQDYEKKTKERIDFIHEKSKMARNGYRPDALQPRSMFMMTNF